MKRDIKLKFISGAVATTLAIGGNFILSNESKSFSDTIVKKKYGTFIEDLDEYEDDYTKYVVQTGDNASLISKKICRYFDKDVTTKYWPVIAYLNEYPRIINKGDEVIFPSDFEDMKSLLNNLDESGWIADYRKMLRKRREAKNASEEDNKENTVGSLIDSIYGAGTSNDSELVKRYLSLVGFSGSYNASTVLSKGEIYRLTEWIPSLEELGVKVKKK